MPGWAAPNLRELQDEIARANGQADDRLEGRADRNSARAQAARQARVDMDGIGAEHQEALALALAEMESLDAEIQREKIAVLVQTKKLEEQQQKHEAVQETQAEALKHIAQKIESMAKDMNELNLAEINISQNVERMRKSTGQAAAYALEDQLSKDICWPTIAGVTERLCLA
tara:strand:+ start:397 stop:912 length:516 start_codon:yes stop_codon:yes gene_type:complete